jgi:hypothetical protein
MAQRFAESVSAAPMMVYRYPCCMMFHRVGFEFKRDAKDDAVPWAPMCDWRIGARTGWNPGVGGI